MAYIARAGSAINDKTYSSREEAVAAFFIHRGEVFEVCDGTNPRQLRAEAAARKQAKFRGSRVFRGLRGFEEGER